MLPLSSVNVIKDDQLELLVIDNNFAKVAISLFGGHLVSYVPKKDNRERLWLSPLSYKNAINPIRGGVPVCWPWFSDLHGQEKGSLPSHGYVRNQVWTIIDSVKDETGTRVVLAPLSAKDDSFNGTPSLTLTVEVGEKLILSLQTKNEGKIPFTLTCALHSYFAVQDITQVEVCGIEGLYEDKTQGFERLNTPAPYPIDQETDRVHLCTSKEVSIVQENAVTTVRSSGHDSLVVWNPWKEKSQDMADMNDDGYKQMLCVETAVTQGLILAPGESHELVQSIE